MVSYTLTPLFSPSSCCSTYFVRFLLSVIYLYQVLFVLKHKPAYDIGQLLEFRRVLFFFQAEDGIRDWSVTGVQTCALPIYEADAKAGIAAGTPRAIEGPLYVAGAPLFQGEAVLDDDSDTRGTGKVLVMEIGRASCRERV